jgi:hypothetical protein
MKKILSVGCLLLVTMVLLFGCQGKTDNSATTQNVLPPQEYNKTFTLQGKIMNALTGAPVGDDAAGALAVYLIQGDIDRGPTKLHSGAGDPLLGEYSISGIPADKTFGEAIFKVVVIKSGYQDFSANINFDATITAGAFANDGTLNMIGNIYLFPIGAVPGDIVVEVRSPHLVPVPGATVLLQQNVTNNTVNALTGDRLLPTAGLYSSMSATTDANGLATFSSANLVLGGGYNAVVEAINFQGDELGTTTSAVFVVGTDSLHQNISMNAAGSSFFVTSASNQIPGTITFSGILTLNFNEPIALTTTAFGATLVSTTSGTVTTPVTGVLSNNNLTLTLTPTFTAPPVGAGATVRYSAVAGQIILQNTQTVAQCGGAPCNLFAVTNGVVSQITGTSVSGDVQLIAN